MILQRYIFRELLISFLLTCAAFSFVMFLAAALQQIHRFEALGFDFVLTAAPYLGPFLLTFTIPISSLAAATLVYGRLAADNEILAMRASGIHPWRVMAPGVALGALLSLGLLALNEYVVPEAKYRTKVLTRKAVTNVLRAPPPGPDAVLNLSQFRITYREFDPKNGAFDHIDIVELSEGRKTREFSAEKAAIRFEDDVKPPVMRLAEANGVVFRPEDNYHRHEIFRSKAWEDLPLLIGDLFGRPRGARDLRRYQLDSLADPALFRDPPPGILPAEIHMEIQRRSATALAPLVLVLVGVPVGILVRRSSKIGGLATILPALLVYFGLALFGESVAEHRALAGLVWTADAVVGAAGVVLTARILRR